MASSGCYILEALGETASSNKFPKVCINCSLPECLLDKNKNYSCNDEVLPPFKRGKTRSFYAQCTNCQCGEEISFDNFGMELKKQFKYEGDDVWHYNYKGEVCGKCKLFVTKRAGG